MGGFVLLAAEFFNASQNLIKIPRAALQNKLRHLLSEPGGKNFYHFYFLAVFIGDKFLGRKTPTQRSGKIFNDRSGYFALPHHLKKFSIGAAKLHAVAPPPYLPTARIIQGEFRKTGFIVNRALFSPFRFHFGL